MYKPLLHITPPVASAPQTTVRSTWLAGLAQSEQVGQAVGKREKCNISVWCCSLIPVFGGMRRAKIRDENGGEMKDGGNARHWNKTLTGSKMRKSDKCRIYATIH